MARKERLPKGSLEPLLRELLRADPGIYSTADLVERTGGDPRAIKRALGRMRARGELVEEPVWERRILIGYRRRLAP